MFEQELITYINGLIQSGIFLESSLIGISEGTNTARAKATVMIENEAKDTFIFIKKNNGIFEWMYLTPKDLIGNELNNTTEWHYPMFPKRLIAPKSLLENYPTIAIQMMIRNLPIVEDQINNTFIIYMNYISPEHQSIIDANQGIIVIEDNPQQ